MDPMVDYRKNYRTIRRLKHAEMEKDKFMEVLKKDQERLQNKIYKKQTHFLEKKLGEYRLKSGIKQLETFYCKGQHADNQQTSGKQPHAKKRTRKRRRRKSRSTIGDRLPDLGTEAEDKAVCVGLLERKLDNGSADVSGNLAPSRGEDDEAWLPDLAALDLDSGVSSDCFEGALSDDGVSDADAVEDASDLRSNNAVQTEVRAAVCSMFDGHDFDVEAAKSSIETDSNISTVSESAVSAQLQRNKSSHSRTKRPKSSPIRMQGAYNGIATYKCDRIVPVLDFTCSNVHGLRPGALLQVEGINIGKKLKVRQCWNGEPEAISSIKRPIQSKEEKRLKKMVTNILDQKPLNVVGEKSAPTKVDKYIPPYPIYFKAGQTSSLIRLNAQTNRPMSAHQSLRITTCSHNNGTARRSPNLAPTRTRPFSAPTKSAQTSVQSIPQPPLTQTREPLKVEVNIEELRVRPRSAIMRQRTSSPKVNSKTASRATGDKGGINVHQSKQMACSYCLAERTAQREQEERRYVKPRTTPRTSDPDISGSSTEEEQQDEPYVMKVFVTSKSGENAS